MLLYTTKYAGIQDHWVKLLSMKPVKYTEDGTTLHGSLTGLDPSNPVIDYGHCWSTTTAVPNLTTSTYSRLGRPTRPPVCKHHWQSGQSHHLFYPCLYAANLGNDTIYGEVVEFSTDLYDIWERKEDLPKGGISGATTFTIGDVGYILTNGNCGRMTHRLLPWVQNQIIRARLGIP